jgi:hypothetical protein
LNVIGPTVNVGEQLYVVVFFPLVPSVPQASVMFEKLKKNGAPPLVFISVKLQGSPLLSVPCQPTRAQMLRFVYVSTMPFRDGQLLDTYSVQAVTNGHRFGEPWQPPPPPPPLPEPEPEPLPEHDAV